MSFQIRPNLKREIEHIIFYEEAHNLIGPTTDDPVGGSVDPKISATKYLVKMLAEVRALGEGIVIADQLPTAMAPEVLKNTGLKLGHRITAQDDRNLLGSTMSASADQLEEQGTFGTGQALIFYENLLKPFKMRVSEWEKGVSQTKYDSPTNMQLFERLKENANYNFLLSRSKTIMQEKMCAEFGILRRQAEELKSKINKNYADICVIEGNLAILEKKALRLTDADDISANKKHIADTKRQYEKKNAEFSGAITRDLKKLCWSYTNQYFAYMTLSKNYYVHSHDMYMCTINNYFSLFAILKSLHDVPGLIEIVIRETETVIRDIAKYIDFSYEDSNVILRDHPEYKTVLCETGNYLINKIELDTDKLVCRAAELVRLEQDAEIEMRTFANDLSETFFKIRKIADQYYEVTTSLSEQLKVALSDNLEVGTPEFDETNLRIVQYESKKLLVYKALAGFVVKIFRRISGISGFNRKVFLTNTSEMLATFRDIVDYRNAKTKTVLSNWSRYYEIWKGTNEILSMEMSARFNYLHNARIDAIGKLHSISSLSEKDALLNTICKQYNTVFQMYSGAGIDSFEFKCCLVNHYCKYLDSVLRLGSFSHSIIRNTSNGTWAICHSLILSLYEDERVDISKKLEWNKIAVQMTNIYR